VSRELAQHYPTRLVCAVLQMPVSSFYYRAQPRDTLALPQALERLAAAWPRFGSRRLTALLRREGWTVNRKRVQRLMADLGLQPKTRRRRRSTTQSRHGFRRFPNRVQTLTIERPDQVWVADITYIHLHTEWVYLAILMDVFTRNIRGWHLTRSLDLSLTFVALERALQHHRPEIHHSDQGIHYAAPTYVARLERCGVQLSMADIGAAWQNGYAERLMRTIKEEEVEVSEYHDYADAYQQLGQFLDQVYTHKRIHSALGFLTPAEFESGWRARH
jgi:putative transposase